VHLSFLSRRIPCIEQLHNVEALLGEKDAVFVWLPVKIQDGNGSPIRAAAFIY
jgi:kynurenine formamidase